jgi:uncharacterized protein (TIGR03382 family)
VPGSPIQKFFSGTAEVSGGTVNDINISYMGFWEDSSMGPTFTVRARFNAADGAWTGYRIGENSENLYTVEYLDSGIFAISAAPVPEPSTVALAVLGFAALMRRTGFSRRRQSLRSKRWPRSS